MAADFEIHRDLEGSWYWTFQAGDNETIARSARVYAHRVECIHDISRIRTLSPRCRIFDMTEAGTAKVVAPDLA